jgi:hypothetical protein
MKVSLTIEFVFVSIPNIGILSGTYFICAFDRDDF